MLIGLVLYCNFKSGTFINLFFDKIFLIKRVNHASPFAGFIYNWGFDIIWSISFFLLLSCFCKNKTALIIILIIIVCFEIFQLFFNNYGTFDYFDLLFESLSIMIIYSVFKIEGKEE